MRWIRAFCLVLRAFGPCRSQASSRRITLLKRAASAASATSCSAFALEIGAVVALDAGGLTAFHLHNPSCHPVEHVAVVGDQHHRSGVAIQPALQPLHSGGVKVVRRFIEQEHIRAGHQGRGQSHAFAVPPGQVLHRSMQITDAQALQHFLALLLQSPGTLFIHPLAQGAELLHRRCVVGFTGHGFRHRTESQQQLTLFSTAREHLFEHRQAWLHDAVLADQFHAQPRRAAPFSSPQGFLARQHAQQCGLSGPIRTDQSHAVVFTNVKGEVLEQGADPEVLGGINQADQTHGLATWRWASR